MLLPVIYYYNYYLTTTDPLLYCRAGTNKPGPSECGFGFSSACASVRCSDTSLLLSAWIPNMPFNLDRLPPDLYQNTARSIPDYCQIYTRLPPDLYQITSRFVPDYRQICSSQLLYVALLQCGFGVSSDNQLILPNPCQIKAKSRPALCPVGSRSSIISV